MNAAPIRETACRRVATSSRSQTESRHCPLCFSNDFDLPRDSSPNASAPWKILRCLRCGLSVTDPRPSPADWEHFYPPCYPPHQAPSVARPLKARWTRFDPYLPRPWGSTKLLEIGCGIGAYLAAMQRQGWRVSGIERSPIAAETARQLFQLPIAIGDFPNSSVDRGPFDMIAAWQVLEHHHDPRAMLAACRQQLKPGGRLALSVPNHRGWAARLFGPDWFALDLPRHLTHFTAATLSTMLGAEGFRIVKLTTIGRSGWIRHSARSAGRFHRRTWKTLLASRLFSRFTSAAAVCCQNGESFFVLASIF